VPNPAHNVLDPDHLTTETPSMIVRLLCVAALSATFVVGSAEAAIYR